MYVLLLTYFLSLGIDSFPSHHLLPPNIGAFELPLLKESFQSVTKSDLEGNNFGVEVTVAYSSTTHVARSQCRNKCQREAICAVAVYCPPTTYSPCFIGDPACSISVKPKVGSCHLMKASSTSAAIPTDKITPDCGTVFIHPYCRETPTIKHALPSRVPRLVDDGVEYTYSCCRGFSAIQGSVKATCSRNGIWNKPVITCKPNGKLAIKKHDTPFSNIAMALLTAGSSTNMKQSGSSKRRTSGDLEILKKLLNMLELRHRERWMKHKATAVIDQDEVKERTPKSDPEDRGTKEDNNDNSNGAGNMHDNGVIASDDNDDVAVESGAKNNGDAIVDTAAADADVNRGRNGSADVDGKTDNNGHAGSRGDDAGRNYTRGKDYGDQDYVQYNYDYGNGSGDANSTRKSNGDYSNDDYGNGGARTYARGEDDDGQDYDYNIDQHYDDDGYDDDDGHDDDGHDDDGYDDDGYDDNGHDDDGHDDDGYDDGNDGYDDAGNDYSNADYGNVADRNNTRGTIDGRKDYEEDYGNHQYNYDEYGDGIDDAKITRKSNGQDNTSTEDDDIYYYEDDGGDYSNYNY